MENLESVEDQKIVSRVYTKYGVSYIGDTKYCGDTYLTGKILEHSINNDEMDVVISPPRKITDRMPPLPVIKYELDNTMTPMEMYQSYFESVKNNKPLNSKLCIQETSTEIFLCEKKQSHSNVDGVENAKKKRKVDDKFLSPFNANDSPISTRSTSNTITYDSSDSNIPFSPTSSTAATITYASSENEDSNVSFGHLETEVGEFGSSQLIDALDLFIGSCGNVQDHETRVMFKVCLSN